MDRLTALQRSTLMSSVRQKDTRPEVTVRSLLHRMGYRFRLHTRTLPGSPDIVLPRHRTVIFVDGCFWHGHSCRAGRLPTTRSDFWKEKIQANRARDVRQTAELANLGWRVVRLWTCQLKETDQLALLLKSKID